MKQYKILYQMPILLFAVMSVLISGCAGGSVTMTANKLDYAVSTTQGLYDSQFNLLSEENYEKVSSFNFTVSRWSLLYSLIPLSANPDISEDINNAIKEKGGDAAVNLQVNVSSMNGGAFFPNFFAAIVPIIPGVVTANISGDIVKLKK